jgi:glutathione S-transferase
MKFYNSIGPNPRLVRMFMAEKGIEMEFEEIDLMGGENRRPPYTDKNPAGEMPALELDDGSVLAETVAICEYLEEMQPDPPLLGVDAESRARSRMWVRRVEQRITDPLTSGFRNAEGQTLFKDRRHLIPQAADDQKAIAQEGLAWLDEQMQGRDFVAGDDLTLADIVLFSMLEFGAQVGQPADPELGHIKAWFERVAARPSAEASQ